MGKNIVIDPVTRLEGHGKIEIFLDSQGKVARVRFRVPDFKGFETFCLGRPAEEMPTLTQKICGVCPTAHHLASTKALDALFDVQPPPAAERLRELIYHAFMFEDHVLHFYFLGGPDFLLDSDAPADRRNIFGVIEALGPEFGRRLIDIRRRVRSLGGFPGGGALYPVFGVPGGISRPMREAERLEIAEIAGDALTLAKKTLGLFHERVLSNQRYRELLREESLQLKTSYMGLVGDLGQVEFCSGRVRLSGPGGGTLAEFQGGEYRDHLEERVSPESYLKPIYLKERGPSCLPEGAEGGVYRVGPLARLNVADGMSTPLADGEYRRMFRELGGKPVHSTMAYHWARVIEILYAAEKMNELAQNESLTQAAVRSPVNGIMGRGVGVCEAPRGTLFHDYTTDENGVVEDLNLLVATQNNGAAISLCVDRAARRFIGREGVSDAGLNAVETAYRAYDPCLACATHAMGEQEQRCLKVYDHCGNRIR